MDDGWMFNDTPAQNKLAIGCQTNGIYIKSKKSNVYKLKIHQVKEMCTIYYKYIN